MTVGEKIRIYKNYSELSYQQIGELTGLSSLSIQRLAYDKTHPQKYSQESLAKIMGITPQELMDEKDPYVPDYKTDKEKLLALITCLLPPALTNYEWSTLPSKREMYWNALMRDGTIKLQPYTWNVLRETFEVLWSQYEFECLYLCDSCLHDKTVTKELPFYKTGHDWCVALLKILNEIKGRHRDRTIFIPPDFISQMVKLRKQLEKENL